MRIIIDRIEGDRAVLEFSDVPGAPGQREMLDVPLAALPSGAQEGQLLTFHSEPASLKEAEARLARLKAKTSQGPGSFDL